MHGFCHLCHEEELLKEIEALREENKKLRKITGLAGLLPEVDEELDREIARIVAESRFKKN